MFCGSCGTNIKDGAKFCPGCGWKVPGAGAQAVPAGEKPAPTSVDGITEAVQETLAEAGTCQYCGKAVEDGWQACPYCGKDLVREILCAGCGKKLDGVWVVCPFCKTPVKKG
jgi:predicted amidophosphoribosyltransferase